MRSNPYLVIHGLKNHRHKQKYIHRSTILRQDQKSRPHEGLGRCTILAESFSHSFSHLFCYMLKDGRLAHLLRSRGDSSFVPFQASHPLFSRLGSLAALTAIFPYPEAIVGQPSLSPWRYRSFVGSSSSFESVSLT